MKANELFEVITIMADNMMNSVYSKEQEESLIKEFRTWLSLSFIGGLINSEDYELVRAFGESKIKENFKNW